MSDEEFRRLSEAYRGEYRRALPEKLAAIEDLWRDLSGGVADPTRIVELQRELHSIAGSARTFGVAGVSEVAAAAEVFLEPFLRRRKLPGPAHRADFERLLGELRRAAT